VYKCSINPTINPNPVYSHPQNRDNWCQKWFDWKLHWILIVIPPKMEANQETLEAEMNAIREKWKPTKTR
jgi:hypothetical protein